MKEQLHPTGTCFDDVIDYINALAQRDPSNILKLNDEIIIVHGICPFNDEKRYAHCWMRTTDYEYMDFRIYKGDKVLVTYTQDEFLSIMKPLRMLKFSIRELVEWQKYFGYPGPWNPEIRNLCPDLEQPENG